MKCTRRTLLVGIALVVVLPFIAGPVPAAETKPNILVLYGDDIGQAKRAPGTMRVWGEPFVKLRLPKLFNLRTDPYERAEVTSNTYWDWYVDHLFIFYPTADAVGRFLFTFKDYPPRQKAGTFTINDAFEKITEGIGAR